MGRRSRLYVFVPEEKEQYRDPARVRSWSSVCDWTWSLQSEVGGPCLPAQPSSSGWFRCLSPCRDVTTLLLVFHSHRLSLFAHASFATTS